MVDRFKNFFLTSICLAASASASPPLFTPWYTDTLLMAQPTSSPLGRFNIQPYVFYFDTYGSYNAEGRVISSPSVSTLQELLFAEAGLGGNFDININIPYNQVWCNGQFSSGFSDIYVALGYQLLYVDETYPDLRIMLFEFFPTGPFQNLQPQKLGSDALGFGAYSTALGVIFRQISYLVPRHPFSTSLNFIYQASLPTHVEGYHAYGGGVGTSGRVYQGGQFTFDAGFELSLTQQWALALDIYALKKQRSTFTGTTGVDTFGNKAVNGAPSQLQVSLAPAIEYNITKNWGVIAGSWFTIEGKNSKAFWSSTISITADF